MEITTDEIFDKLSRECGWCQIVEDLQRWSGGPPIPAIILKHPTKKLYYYNGTFGKQYRVYKGRQVDISRAYYKCGYKDKFDYDGAMKTLTLDDFICINLN